MSPVVDTPELRHPAGVAESRTPGRAVDEPPVAKLMVTRWRRFGHDRLFVSTPDRETVGWLDLTTGARTVKLPKWSAQFAESVGEYLHEHPHLAKRVRLIPAQRGNAAARSADRPPRPSWRDLTQQIAGASQRLRVREVRDARRHGTGDRPELHRHERDLIAGAEGQEYVGQRLEELRPHGWHLIHSIPLGPNGADIDHLLIGPGGVVTLNTQNCAGADAEAVRHIRVCEHQIYFDGHQTNQPVAVRQKAAEAERVLSRACGFAVDVLPALVILTGPNAPRIEFSQPTTDLLVLDWTTLIPRLAGLPTRLPEWRKRAVFSLARKSTTWPGGHRFPADGESAQNAAPPRRHLS